MSIFEEMKPPPPPRWPMRRIILILGMVAIALIVLFTCTDVGTDIGFIAHFVTPPGHLTYSGHTQYVRGVAWSPDGQEIASCGGDGTIQIWQANTGKLLHTYRGHHGDVFSLAWSPDGKYLVSRSEERRCRE